MTYVMVVVSQGPWAHSNMHVQCYTCLFKSRKVSPAPPMPGEDMILREEGHPQPCPQNVLEGLGSPPTPSLMRNPSHEPPHLSSREALALTALQGVRHLQSPVVAPCICIHFTQSLFISKINSSPTDSILQKRNKNTAAALPVAILVLRLSVAGTSYVGVHLHFRAPDSSCPGAEGEALLPGPHVLRENIICGAAEQGRGSKPGRNQEWASAQGD